MCHREASDSVGEDGLGDRKHLGESNNNTQSGTMAGGFLAAHGWNEPRPACSCMAGDRRVRRRHPATVQTPGRTLAEGEVMEPLVTHRLAGERLTFNSARDFNDNYSCDQEKFYEVQFAMDFSHLRTAPSPQRFGGLDDNSSSENLKKNRILSSKLK